MAKVSDCSCYTRLSVKADLEGIDDVGNDQCSLRPLPTASAAELSRSYRAVLEIAHDPCCSAARSRKEAVVAVRGNTELDIVLDEEASSSACPSWLVFHFALGSYDRLR